MRMLVNLVTYNVDIMVGYAIMIWCEYNRDGHLFLSTRAGPGPGLTFIFRDMVPLRNFDLLGTR